MLDPQDFRQNTIRVFSKDGIEIETYSGKIYIYFGETKENCFHFVDENGRHHRIYGKNTIIVDEC